MSTTSGGGLVERGPVDGAMSRHDDDHVGPFDQAREIDAVADDAIAVAEPRDMRIVETDVSTARGDAGDDVCRGRVPIVLDVGLERHADDPDPCTPDRPSAVVQRLGHQVDHVARHRQVDVTGELDEAVHEVELASPPRQVVRVDRDAVAADPGTGREPHEPERLGRGRVDDLPDIETHPLAQQRELVDERDVHVAEDVLEQLGHLGRVGRRHRDHAVIDLAQQEPGALGGLRRSSRRRGVGPREPRSPGRRD